MLYLALLCLGIHSSLIDFMLQERLSLENLTWLGFNNPHEIVTKHLPVSLNGPIFKDGW